MAIQWTGAKWPFLTRLMKSPSARCSRRAPTSRLCAGVKGSFLADIKIHAEAVRPAASHHRCLRAGADSIEVGIQRGLGTHARIHRAHLLGDRCIPTRASHEPHPWQLGRRRCFSDAVFRRACGGIPSVSTVVTPGRYHERRVQKVVTENSDCELSNGNCFQ